MAMMILHEPQSRERYVAQVNDHGTVFRAFGPIHHSEHPDSDAMSEALDNQVAGEEWDTGRWLAGLMERGGMNHYPAECGDCSHDTEENGLGCWCPDCVDGREVGDDYRDHCRYTGMAPPHADGSRCECPGFESQL